MSLSPVFVTAIAFESIGIHCNSKIKSIHDSGHDFKYSSNNICTFLLPYNIICANVVSTFQALESIPIKTCNISGRF